VVYTHSRVHDGMDGNGDDDMTVMCCGVEREEIYMGGGLLVYKCHTCGSRMETNVK
jgi:hypothetical protein